MDLTQRITQHFHDSAKTKLDAAAALSAPVARATRIMADALQADCKILACGNGGSAADSQHFAAELLGRFERERRELAAIALTTDTSAITAIANDYAYKDIFAKQLRGLGRKGDVLLAISTSGNSANVVEAISAAHARGMRVVAMTGNGGGKIAAVLKAEDTSLCVPSTRTARIQEVHLLMLHCLCDGIDQLLFGEEK